MIFDIFLRSLKSGEHFNLVASDVTVLFLEIRCTHFQASHWFMLQASASGSVASASCLLSRNRGAFVVTNVEC